MPELPEVETVKESLKKIVCGKKIKDVTIYYKNIIAYPISNIFIQECISRTIYNIERRGKWLIFVLDDYFLLSHLRMEGKYLLKDEKDEKLLHEHVCFLFEDGTSLRYIDTRKFGKMYLLKKELAHKRKPLCDLGIEPFDIKLTSTYLKERLRCKKVCIKKVLLDQSIIAGIGNIYVDEILFLSKIHPLTLCNILTVDQLEDIIENIKSVLKRAIDLGGTTVRTFTSSEGVHGRFQNELLIHNHVKEPCPICKTLVQKIKVGGRGTYFCPTCQKIK